VNDTNPIDYDSRRREVIGAAHAAASWVRARRSAWSQSAPGISAPTVETPAVPAIRELPAVVAFGLSAPPPAPVLPVWAPHVPDEDDFTAASDVPLTIPEDNGPSAVSRAIEVIRSVRLPIGRWLAFAAAAALVFTVGVTVKAYWWKGAAKAKAAVNALDAVVAGTPRAAGVRGAEKPHQTTGRLALTSEPAGAQVFLDGTARGVTPMTVDDLAPGSHVFELRGREGSIRRSVVVAAGETTEVAESIFGGFVKVFAPFDVVISEGAKVFRLEEGNQVMMPAGRHDLHVVNRKLGYDTVHRVEVKPGETASLSLTLPSSMLTVNASEPAEVWVDSVHVGATPLVRLPIDVGTHEILVRRADGDERRSVVTATVKPLAVDVDFSKP
jgi:hypothetical protein